MLSKNQTLNLMLRYAQDEDRTLGRVHEDTYPQF